MRIIRERPTLRRLEKLIADAREQEYPKVSHVEVTKQEWFELLRDLRERNQSHEPSDTTTALVVSGVHVNRYNFGEKRND